jgi:septum formation protein
MNVFTGGAPLILASSSPRRRDILTMLGIPFLVCEPGIDETLPSGTPVEEVPVLLAVQKAEAVAKRLGHRCPPEAPFLILAADTIVVLDGVLYGKPTDEADARRILKVLSGRTHRVLTGLALHDRRATGKDDLDAPPGASLEPSRAPSFAVAKHRCTNQTRTRLEHADVTFAPLDTRDIDAYLASGEWQGVAGAYRMQGRGAALVTRIEGLESTIIGLPIRPLWEMLSE